MVAKLSLQLEVVGCPTACRHCWAQGTAYPAMPVDDVAWVLEQAHRFCQAHRLEFGAYPMHEAAAHPQAAEIMRLVADYVGPAEFDPLATTGVPLATREDWEELLAAATRLGTTTVWVAFHGIGGEHDRQVNRQGAYAETCLAVRRVHAAGLRAGGNVFVTSANASQAERLLGALQRLEVEEMAWEPATFLPTPRGRRNERLRPELAALAPLADRILRVSPFHRDAWADLAACTEAAWTARALAGDWPPQTCDDGGLLELVCRPNLDLHVGWAGWHRERLGNLRSDEAFAVLGRGLDHGERSRDGLWFGPDRLPSVAELAASYADPAGQGIHFSHDSVRLLWLDRAKRPMQAIGA
jgi:hypothetical protein